MISKHADYKARENSKYFCLFVYCPGAHQAMWDATFCLEMTNIKVPRVILAVFAVSLVVLTLYQAYVSFARFISEPTFMASSFQDQKLANFPDITFCLYSGIEVILISIQF